MAEIKIFTYTGDDLYGRKVIVFAACKLPPSAQIDHQRLLEYVTEFSFNLMNACHF